MFVLKKFWVNTSIRCIHKDNIQVKSFTIISRMIIYEIRK